MISVLHLKGRDDVEAEARAWIVQLDGRAPSREDLAALAEWARRSPRHAACLREAADLWGQLDGLAEVLKEVTPAPERRPALRAWSVAAAAGGLAAALVGAAYVGVVVLREPSAASAAHTLHATRVGEQRTIALPDGSSAELNTDSVLEVDYSAGERTVRVVHGEAMFDVEHDTSRPFIVLADASAVRAVGTQFAVRLEPERLEVTVSEGAVDLIPRVGEDRAADAVRVAAYQAASVTDGEPVVSDLDVRTLDRRLSWRDGVLEFEGEPLSEVVAEVSRYTELQLVISDSELGNLRIGGRFGVGETERLLDALESGFGVRVTRGEGPIVRLSLE
jgi:transmembrane sensor